MNDHPAVPSMIAKVFERRQRGLPNYVARHGCGPAGRSTRFPSAAPIWAARPQPFMVPGDPSSPKFSVENLAPLAGPESTASKLLGQLDTWSRKVDKTGAFRLARSIQSPGRRTGDQRQGPGGVRSFARARFAQGSLRPACLWCIGACWPGGWSRPAARSSRWCSRIRCPAERCPNYVSYNWDSHAVNCHIFNDAKLRFPLYDQAVTALDRRSLPARAGSPGAVGRDGRIRPHAAAIVFGRHIEPRHAAGPRSLAQCDVDDRFRRRHAHRPGDRRHERQGRISDRTAAVAERPVGHGAAAPGHRSRNEPSTTSPAAPCRFCRSATRSASCCRLVDCFVSRCVVRHWQRSLPGDEHGEDDQKSEAVR